MLVCSMANCPAIASMSGSYTIFSFRPLINAETWVSISGKVGNESFDNLMIFHDIR